MTVIRQQANQILASRSEGEIAGVITAIEYYHPNATTQELILALKEICKETYTEEELDYYIEYFGLINS